MAGEINGTPVESSDDQKWKVAAAKEIAELRKAVNILIQQNKNQRKK